MIKTLNPPRIIVLSFLTAILCGAFLLNLPISTQTGESLGPVNSLFTATSAICVTGLTVKDTGGDFSLFGQLVIIMLVQAGGLGIMTFSVLFTTVLLHKRLTISQGVAVQNALGYTKTAGLKDLIKYIVLITFFVESLGALMLYMHWAIIMQGANNYYILWSAVFHSISAFCNAGFSIFTNSLVNLNRDAFTMLTIAFLIISGGLGFVAVLELPRLRYYFSFFRKKTLAALVKKQISEDMPINKISLHTKMVLTATIFLIAIGTVVIFFLEYGNALSQMPFWDKILNAFFTSVTPRTAGFNSVPTNALQAATKFFIAVLMFIGASPGSTGGGIKTVTAIVLFAGFIAMLKKRDRMTFSRRTIEKDAFRRAVAIFVLSLGLVCAITLLLTITERALFYKSNEYFLNLFFETTSAFATCGLSTITTAHLSVIGKILIMLTMFLGRVGPLTAALALALRKEEKAKYIYPEEKIMVG
ncbi:MAG: Trk family potassium uptake protein [Candidatus Omnitrophica bacterium]|nr:Trk family potassium uptake protein [Candidatus Omnitrophota bacterium]